MAAHHSVNWNEVPAGPVNANKETATLKMQAGDKSARFPNNLIGEKATGDRVRFNDSPDSNVRDDGSL